MVTQVRDQSPFNAYPIAARIRSGTNTYRELEPRVIALTAVSPEQRRVILHLFVLAIVVVAAVVGAFAT